MSVIPFDVETDDRTVVCNKDDFYTSKGRNGEVVLIENMDPDQLKDFRDVASPDANTSYDLTVGSEYIDLADKSKHGVSKEQPIELRPGAAVIIETAEYVHFPVSRFGHIVPKVSMLHEGVSNTSSKIDPGYEGRLAIAVFNLGKNTAILEKGSRFCTLYVLAVDLSKRVRAYRKPPKSLPPGQPRNYIKVLTDLANAHGWVSILVSLVALALSVLAVVLGTVSVLK